jgi:hypothetical protein
VLIVGHNSTFESRLRGVFFGPEICGKYACMHNAFDGSSFLYL